MSEPNPNQEAIGCPTSTPSGMPSWFSKTARYDDNDIEFSLPNADDGAFFSIHFGQNEDAITDSAASKSSFDRINEELGFHKSGSGIGLGVSPSKGSGLNLSAELQQYSLLEEVDSFPSSSPSPGYKFGYRTTVAAVSPLASDNTPRQRKETIRGAPPPSFTIGGDDDDGDLSGAIAKVHLNTIDDTSHKEFSDSLTEKLGQISEIKRDNSIFSKVKQIFLRTEPSSPVQSAKNSPKASRKISAPLYYNMSKDMQKPTQEEPKYKPVYENAFYVAEPESQAKRSKYNAYFYQYEWSKLGKNEEYLVDPKRAAEYEEAVKKGEKPNDKIVWRPKPNQYRDMNVWAPTSM